MLAMRISNIEIILEIFIAEARFLCPKPIANRIAGNRMSWPRKSRSASRPDGGGSRNNRVLS